MVFSCLFHHIRCLNACLLPCLSASSEPSFSAAVGFSASSFPALPFASPAASAAAPPGTSTPSAPDKHPCSVSLPGQGWRRRGTLSIWRSWRNSAKAKSHGLFDSFLRDCLALADTKLSYQNLRQKVDTSLSTPMDQQAWNRNPRNGLRQSMVQAGVLEAGVDRIISLVVDPKRNHLFRPQKERAIFLVSWWPRKTRSRTSAPLSSPRTWTPRPSPGCLLRPCLTP
ncbi:hypothetical protein QTO34_015845 [Cnephaeus nilssonii]|uniref:BOD1/SHG1 domain-containing protein n=1 Tax=Cnephaeus nilssonii TaxID=3371016 RepID=A0AA40I4U6_CNENI|nr:hypothetical protein QTO34_015845 [Eptesicus nilssonii]